MPSSYDDLPMARKPAVKSSYDDLPMAQPGIVDRVKDFFTPADRVKRLFASDNGSSAAGSATRAAARGTVPALGGAAGFGAGFATAGVLASPVEAVPVVGTVAHGLLALGGGLAGAMGAGYLVDKAQSAVIHALPTKVQQFIGQDDVQQQADQREHPNATFAGGLAPMMLSMRPGFSASAVPAGASKLTRALAHPLTGSAIGATVSGGGEAAGELARGEPLSATKIGIATVVGGAMNRPTTLGNKLFQMGGNAAVRAGMATARGAGQAYRAAGLGEDPLARQGFDATATAREVPQARIAAPDTMPAASSYDDLPMARAPAVVEPAPLRPEPGALVDGERMVRTPAGASIRTRMGVVDSSALTQAEGDNQNRDRSRDTTALQVQDIVSKFDPEQLHEDPSSDRGAPIVGPDGAVDSGNGRVLALNEIHDNHPELAAKYRAMIEARGLSTEGIDRPILVQHRMTDMSPEQRRQFVIDSNKDTKLELSPTERARSDADSITPDMLEKYAGGDLNSTANAGFVEHFNKGLTTGEMGNMIGSDRRLTTAGSQRIENAIVARAYGNPKLLERMMESSHDDIRSITGSLADVAAPWAKMTADAKSGVIDKGYDITSDLTDAAARVSDARKAGTRPNDILAQQDAFDQMSPVTAELVRAFHNPTMTRAASRKSMTSFLQDYVAQAHAQKATGGLFGAEPPRAPLTLIKDLLDERDNPNGAGLALEDAKDINHEPQASSRGNEGSDRGSASQDEKPAAVREGREASAPIREESNGPEGEVGNRVDGSPTHADGATTDRLSTNRSAVEHLGMAWDDFNLKAPPAQVQLLQRAMKEKLGLRVTVGDPLQSERVKPQTRIVVDQLLDGFHNMQGMAHVLGIPAEAISLGRTLSLKLVKNAKFHGQFTPESAQIALPGRSNSFAHEWSHALDFYLLGKLAPEMGKGLSGAIRIKGARIATPDSEIVHRFIDVLNTMFYDKAGLAAKIMELEAHATGASTPAAKAQFQRQIDNIKAGNGKPRGVKSDYAANAANYEEKGGDYWTSPTEMMARAFEAYVAHKAEAAGLSTEVISHADADYLSNADARLAKTFPKGDERDGIFEAFDNLFKTLADNEALARGSAATRPVNPEKRTPQQEAAKLSRLDHTLREEIGPWVDMFRTRRKAAEGRPASVGVGRTLNNLRASWFSSMASEARTIASRTGSKSVMKLHDLLTYEAGKGDRLQRRNHVEDVRRRSNRYHSTLEQVLTNHGPREVEGGKKYATVLTLEQNDDVRSMMTDDAHVPALPELKPFASEMRTFFNSVWHDMRRAGLELGFARNGYLPRRLDIPKIEADRDGFLADAKTYYMQEEDMGEGEARGAAAEWLKRIVSGNPNSFDRHGPSATFAKARSMTPAADKIMAKWYKNDVMELAHDFAQSAAARIEYVRRFGLPTDSSEAPKLSRLFDRMVDEGVSHADRNTLDIMTRITTGQNPYALNDPAWNAAISWTNALYGTATALPRSVVSSLHEILSAAVVLEHPKYGVLAVAKQMAVMLGTPRGKELKKIAALMGHVEFSQSGRMVAERFGGSYSDSVNVQALTSKIFYNTGLVWWTRQQKIANIDVGHAYMLELAKDYLESIDRPRAAGSNAPLPPTTGEKEALRRFNEYGIRSPEAFARWITVTGKHVNETHLTGGLEPGDTNPMAYDWITAIGRIDSNIIQEPSPMDAPRGAHTVFGRFFHAIQRFIYSQYEHIIKPIGLKMMERFAAGDRTFASLAMVKTAIGALMVAAGATLFASIRVYLSDQRRWKEEEAKGDLNAYLMKRGSNSAFSTPLDRFVQAYTGIKSNRPGLFSLFGPTVNNMSGIVSDEAGYFAKNSTKNTTAEHNAVRGAVRAVAPFAVLGASAIPGGPIASGLVGAFQAAATAPDAGERVGDAIYGPKKKPHHGHRAPREPKE